MSRHVLGVEIDDPKDINKFENLILNFLGGMKPQHLSEDEVDLLEENVGENWFEEMGFSDFEEYEKPDF